MLIKYIGTLYIYYITFKDFICKVDQWLEAKVNYPKVRRPYYFFDIIINIKLYTVAIYINLIL